jgi:hypothetical protein
MSLSFATKFLLVVLIELAVNRHQVENLIFEFHSASHLFEAALVGRQAEALL